MFSNSSGRSSFSKMRYLGTTPPKHFFQLGEPNGTELGNKKIQNLVQHGATWYNKLAKVGTNAALSSFVTMTRWREPLELVESMRQAAFDHHGLRCLLMVCCVLLCIVVHCCCTLYRVRSEGIPTELAMASTF